MKSTAWLLVLVGIWLIMAPYVLGYAQTTAAKWSDIGSGVVVAIGALLLALRQQGHMT